MENTVLAFIGFEMIVKMSDFFWPCFKQGHNYVVPLDHILQFKRKYFRKIDYACSGPVCESAVPCNGHKFKNYMQNIVDALMWATEEKKVYYKNVLFSNLKFSIGKKHKWSKNTCPVLESWEATPVDPKCLKNYTYSKRMAFFN